MGSTFDAQSDTSICYYTPVRTTLGLGAFKLDTARAGVYNNIDKCQVLYQTSKVHCIRFGSSF